MSPPRNWSCTALRYYSGSRIFTLFSLCDFCPFLSWLYLCTFLKRIFVWNSSGNDESCRRLKTTFIFLSPCLNADDLHIQWRNRLKCACIMRFSCCNIFLNENYSSWLCQKKQCEIQMVITRNFSFWYSNIPTENAKKYLVTFTSWFSDGSNDIIFVMKIYVY